eukprot:6734266-Pyramimonas_sp.AAC.2
MSLSVAVFLSHANVSSMGQFPFSTCAHLWFVRSMCTYSRPPTTSTFATHPPLGGVSGSTDISAYPRAMHTIGWSGTSLNQNADETNDGAHGFRATVHTSSHAPPKSPSMRPPPCIQGLGPEPDGPIWPTGHAVAWPKYINERRPRDQDPPSRRHTTHQRAAR